MPEPPWICLFVLCFLGSNEQICVFLTMGGTLSPLCARMRTPWASKIVSVTFVLLLNDSVYPAALQQCRVCNNVFEHNVNVCSDSFSPTCVLLWKNVSAFLPSIRVLLILTMSHFCHTMFSHVTLRYWLYFAYFGYHEGRCKCCCHEFVDKAHFAVCLSCTGRLTVNVPLMFQRDRIILILGCFIYANDKASK